MVAAPSGISGGAGAEELPPLENWAIRKALGVLHEALEAQATQIEALTLEVRQLRSQERQGVDHEKIHASLQELSARVASLEARVDRQASADHDQLKVLELKGKIRQIAREVVEKHEGYSMVGEARVKQLEEGAALLAVRLDKLEEGLQDRPTTSEVKSGFEDLLEELKTQATEKADACAVENEIDAVLTAFNTKCARMDGTTSALEEKVEAAATQFQEVQEKNRLWLIRLEESQRDLLDLADNQAVRIKNITHGSRDEIDGLRNEIDLLRSVVAAGRPSSYSFE